MNFQGKPPLQVKQGSEPIIEEKDELLDEEDEHTEQHKPKFVKHLNKTRTMSAKQKWEWAFDKILTVGNFPSHYHHSGNFDLLVGFFSNLLFYCKKNTAS